MRTAIIGALAVVFLGCAAESEPTGAPGGELGAGLTEETVAMDTREDPSPNVEAPAIGFMPAQGCPGVAGTWKAQIYSPPHGGYYEFTLHVLDAAVGGGALTGTILAHSWSGSSEDFSPPDACEGGYHWTVSEDAVGQVKDEGKVTFGGTSWSVAEKLCGEDVTDYSLDQLDAVLPAGDGATHMSGRIHDSAVWTDGMPAELTRVSCE